MSPYPIGVIMRRPRTSVTQRPPEDPTIPARPAIWADLPFKGMGISGVQTRSAFPGAGAMAVAGPRQIADMIGGLGMRVARFGQVIPGQAFQRNLAGYLRDMGVRMMGSATWLPTATNPGETKEHARLREMVTYWAPGHPEMLIVEPQNESQRTIQNPGLWDYAGDYGVTQLQVDHSPALWAARNDLAPTIPVLLPSMATKRKVGTTITSSWYWRMAKTAAGADFSFAPYVTHTNLHSYQGGFRPLMTEIPSSMAVYIGPQEMGKAAPGKPAWITETGYHNLVNYTGSHIGTPEDVAGRYVARMPFDFYRELPTLTGWLYYELVDDSPWRAPGSTPTPDHEEHFGLYFTDWTGTQDSPRVAFRPKPAAAALLRLKEWCHDPGSAITAQPLRVRWTGAPTDYKVHLLQKRSGTWVIAAYRDVSLYNPSTKTRISVTDTAVRFELGITPSRIRTLNVYTGAETAVTIPTDGSNPSFTLQAGPDVWLAEITP